MRHQRILRIQFVMERSSVPERFTKGKSNLTWCASKENYNFYLLYCSFVDYVSLEFKLLLRLCCIIAYYASL